MLAKWNEPRMSENKFIGLSLDDRYCGLIIFSLPISFINSSLAAVPSSVALPMESCERRHLTLEAIAVRKPLTLHLFPIDCVTGECPTIEKPSHMAATKWIFQFGARNSHGNPNQNPVLCRDHHLKSGKEVKTFSQQRYGELAMLDIFFPFHGILLTHHNRFPMITWAFGNQFASLL